MFISRLRSRAGMILAGCVVHAVMFLSMQALRHRGGFRYAVYIIKWCLLIFRRPMRNLYSAGTASYLTQNLIRVCQEHFESRYLLHRLTVESVHNFLAKVEWKVSQAFLDHQSVLCKESAAPISPFLLCTHTGDYWVSILNLAMAWKGQNVDFVVPIYQQIDERAAAIFGKIDISGVNVIFLNIHAPGAMLKLKGYFRRKDAVIAVFYDLSCQIGRVYNGNVDSVDFLSRKAYMTTGILRIASRSPRLVHLVSCNLCEIEHQYRVSVSEPYSLADTDALRIKMVSLLETCLEKSPSQWHFINHLDSYFHYPFSKLRKEQAALMTLGKRLSEKYSPDSRKEE